MLRGGPSPHHLCHENAGYSGPTQLGGGKGGSGGASGPEVALGVEVEEGSQLAASWERLSFSLLQSPEAPPSEARPHSEQIYWSYLPVFEVYCSGEP